MNLLKGLLSSVSQPEAMPNGDARHAGFSLAAGGSAHDALLLARRWLGSGYDLRTRTTNQGMDPSANCRCRKGPFAAVWRPSCSRQDFDFFVTRPIVSPLLDRLVRGIRLNGVSSMMYRDAALL